ncbi:MAG: aspartate kinase [Deltaproteobacteria bacterium]|nr:aspartate kinase [Deltaproteobacteria bacterium]
MIVMKFGGSSVRDAERIECVSEIIRQHLARHPVIVVSALGSTTNNLIAAGKAALQGRVDLTTIKQHHLKTAQDLGLSVTEIEPLFEDLENLLKGICLLDELSPKTLDHLVSFGERLAAIIVAAYLTMCKIPAKPFNAWELGVITNSTFGDAEISPESYDHIAAALGSLKQCYDFTPVVTGFIAKDKNGAITTFGRGGSDLTASLLGAALKVEEIQVWKDVDGILTTDPKIVTAARPVLEISFEEASELAYFGAKVLHPLSMQPAMNSNIRVRVKNSYNPGHPGTIISGDPQQNGLVKAITCKRNVTLIDIVSSRMLGQYGFLASLFQVFAKHQISVDMVATSEISVSLTLNQEQALDAVLAELGAFSRVNLGRGKAILGIVGNIKRSSEILDGTFNILHAHGINVQMISQGASKVNIGLIVEDSEVELCVKELHRYFFEDQRIAA